MTSLVLGASGATGQLVVQQLLKKGQSVRIIVRSLDALPHEIVTNSKVAIVCASVLEMTEKQLLDCIEGCESVVSCLGHNLTWKGIFGQPKHLVTEATIRVCRAIIKSRPLDPIKFILMNTSGFQNKELGERVSLSHKAVISLIRALFPPHIDNEMAVQFLQTKLDKDQNFVQWTAVRPDSLTNEPFPTQYDIHPSPISDPIFSAKKTSRINVAVFMSELITTPSAWNKWQGQTPVVYNSIQ
ncbi:NAD(P)H-binding protein [Vibrio profundi]|uniref:NAD(P)H-binding protein n=1 Tax=Vibrio profundi TaxID=1774960 RepID=UPI00373545E2